MTNIKKILISDKYVISELKKLNESFTNITEETKKKYEDFIFKFEIDLNNILKRKFKFIDHIEFKTKLNNFSVFEETRYYYLIDINVFINIDQLPNYDKLHSFIQHFHKKEKWNASLSNIKNFYMEDDFKQIGDDLTKKIQSLINISAEYFTQFKSFDLNDFDFLFEFYY